ncbi:MAG: hypothetical protein M3N02_06860 [Pseudomonadota bacterium]|nr:hypothetical protein [Pseudomonadota bacterium]
MERTDPVTITKIELAGDAFGRAEVGIDQIGDAPVLEEGQSDGIEMSRMRILHRFSEPVIKGNKP